MNQNKTLTWREKPKIITRMDVSLSLKQGRNVEVSTFSMFEVTYLKEFGTTCNGFMHF